MNKIKEILKNIEKEDKSGFFDLPSIKEKCTHHEHEPPKYMVIPQGKGYRHICPACRQETIIIPQQVSL